MLQLQNWVAYEVCTITILSIKSSDETEAK